MLKVEVIEKEEEMRFPCLLTDNRGVIILATADKGNYYKGTILKGGDMGDNSIGQVSAAFIKKPFEIFKGGIVLSNDKGVLKWK